LEENQDIAKHARWEGNSEVSDGWTHLETRRQANLGDTACKYQFLEAVCRDLVGQMENNQYIG
jgi:hypothetical protein